MTDPVAETHVSSAGEDVLGGLISEIPVETGVEQCVRKFLKPYKEAIAPHEEHASSERKLDYLKMRRFIFTAYNNLVEMDHTISEGRIVQPKAALLHVQKHYEELEKMLNRPGNVNFEKVFLTSQSYYKEVVSLYETKKAHGEYLSSRLMQIKVSMDEYGKRYRLASKKSPEYAQLETIFKRLNGEYVDRLHDQSILREEIAKLYGVIEKFKKQHELEFNQYFYDKSREFVEFVQEVLNGLAYEYDTILWEEAKDSDSIRKFFAESKIQGSFSSKTFLKYYLKHLDKELLSGEQEGLQQLLSYLEEISKKNIFIMGSDIDEVNALKLLVEGIDKEYVVVTAISSEKIFVEHTRSPFDLIIIDYRLRQLTGLELMDKFWEAYTDTRDGIPVLMRFRNPTYEEVDHAGRAGIRYFIRSSVGKTEFIEKVKRIL